MCNNLQLCVLIYHNKFFFEKKKRNDKMSSLIAYTINKKRIFYT